MRAKVAPQVAARHDVIDHAVLERYSARWNRSGNVSRIVSAITRAPAKPTIALGSASVMSPTIANDAETPPVVGSVNNTM